jgi:hypothetical protein
MIDQKNRRQFLALSVGLALTWLSSAGCSGSGKAPATRPLTKEEIEQVKREDQKTEDEESTGGSGQKPKNSR